MSHGESAGPAPRVTLPLPCSSDDSKSSSPEPVTHLKWDDPYYDIARHQIVEVAGKRSCLREASLYATKKEHIVCLASSLLLSICTFPHEHGLASATAS